MYKIRRGHPECPRLKYYPTDFSRYVIAFDHLLTSMQNAEVSGIFLFYFLFQGKNPRTQFHIGTPTNAPAAKTRTLHQIVPKNESI